MDGVSRRLFMQTGAAASGGLALKLTGCSKSKTESKVPNLVYLTDADEIYQRMPRDFLNRMTFMLLQVARDPMYHPPLRGQVEDIKSFRENLTRNDITGQDLMNLEGNVKALKSFVDLNYIDAEYPQTDTLDQAFLRKVIALDPYRIEFEKRMLRNDTSALPSNERPSVNPPKKYELAKNLIDNKVLTPLEALRILWGKIDGELDVDDKFTEAYLLKLYDEHGLKSPDAGQRPVRQNVLPSPQNSDVRHSRRVSPGDEELLRLLNRSRQ